MGMATALTSVEQHEDRKSTAEIEGRLCAEQLGESNVSHWPTAAVRGGYRRWLAAGYNCGYTCTMKTAISIPDAIFEEAERLAKTRGWSRSELYSNAVSAYVNSERFLGVREKLDAVYGQNVDDSAVDSFLAKAQARSLPKEKW